MLDITVGHLRRLCGGQRFPSQDLIKECRRLEEAPPPIEWQRHTVRGFIAGTVKKRFGIEVTAAKVEGRETVYSIAANA